MGLNESADQPNDLPLTSLVFIYLYSPYLNVGGVIIHLPYLVMLSLCVYFLFRISRPQFVDLDLVVKLVALMNLPLAYFFLISGFFSQIDIEMLVNYANWYLTFGAAGGIALYLQRRRAIAGFDVIVKAFCLATVLHCVVMLCGFLIPGFRDLLYSVVVLGDKGLEFVELSYRSPGLTSAGGDVLSHTNGLALVLALYCYVSERSYRALSALVSIVLLMSGVLLSGRTGLVVIGLGATLYFLSKGWSFLVSLRFKTFTFLRLMMSLWLTILSLVSFYFAAAALGFERLLFRSSEIFLNLFLENEVSTTSTAMLSDMYILPSTQMQIVFGDGNFGRSAGLAYIESDVGFVRAMFGGGMVLLLLLIILYLYMFHCARSYLNQSQRWILFFLLTSFFVMNFKSFHLVGSSLAVKVFMLFLLSATFISRCNARHDAIRIADG